jgi:hypothetical protein
VPLEISHRYVGHLRWNRETLELATSDAQQLIILLPADEATAAAAERLRGRAHRTTLRAV